MPEWYHEFVARGHRPAASDVVALFRFTPAAGISDEEALGRIASESSVGTWTDLAALPSRIPRLRGLAYAWQPTGQAPARAADRGAARGAAPDAARRARGDAGRRSKRGARTTGAGGLAWVSYPRELWEPGNLPQLLSGVAGNIFGMKAVRRLRLEDVRLPPWYLRGFRGPELGIAGLRRRLRVTRRPLTATVPKPKLGWSAAEHAQRGLEAWLGGIDLIKDDENLTSQRFNRFEQRVARLTRMRERAERERGEACSALLNVTAETDEARRRMQVVADHGWEYAMVDVVVTGWSALSTLREAAHDHGLALHAHRAMHAMFTKDVRHGMSMPCLAKLLRLVGVDQLHAGTVVGKLESPKAEVLATADVLRDRRVRPRHERATHLLAQDWGSTKPVFPVSSGGLHPGLVAPVLDLFGPEVVVQAGGGVHGHPQGAQAGARALRAAIDAWMDGVPTAQAARKDPALAKAMSKWGRKRPR